MLEKIFKSRKQKVRLLKFFDFCFLKKKNKVLIVIKHSVDFSGNLRIVTEEFIKLQDDFIIYIYKDGIIHKEAKEYLKNNNVVFLEGFSLYTLFHIITSGIVIVGHTIRDAYISKTCYSRFVVNLWHGVVFKNIELLMNNLNLDKKKLIRNNSKIYNLILSSSKEDKLKMQRAFNVKNVYISGLLRYEILKQDYYYKDQSLENEKIFIEKLKSNKKLVLYAPTFRETNYDPLSELCFDKIVEVAKKNNFIFCIRVHPYTKILKKYKYLDNIIFLNNDQYKETNLLLKYTDLLIVDYSSIWIDFLLLDKPIIMYTPDIESYVLKERGFAYTFSDVIDFNIYKDFSNVLSEIVFLLNKETIEYHLSKHVFHQYDLSFDYRKEFMRIFYLEYKDLLN